LPIEKEKPLSFGLKRLVSKKQPSLLSSGLAKNSKAMVNDCFSLKLNSGLLKTIALSLPLKNTDFPLPSFSIYSIFIGVPLSCDELLSVT
jgi:hypothetical protein